MFKFILLSLISISSILFYRFTDYKKNYRKISSKDYFSPVIESYNDYKKYTKRYSLKPYIMTGTLRRDFVENFETGEYTEKLYLVNGKRKLRIKAFNVDIAHLINKKIKFKGNRIGNSYYGTAFNKSRIKRMGSFRRARRLYDNYDKILVLLVNFKNSNTLIPPGVGQSSINYKTFADHINKGKYRNYMRSVSGNKIYDKVTHVENWYTFNRDYRDTHYPGYPWAYCYLSNDDIKLIIKERGIDVKDYDNISFVINCGKEWTSWGVASRVQIDGRQLSTASMMMSNRFLQLNTQRGMEMSRFMRNFLHERLHNYGVGHSKAVDCNDNKNPYPCETVVYGNPFDLMGGPSSGTSLNADTLRVMGWRQEHKYLKITKPGIYTISPLINSKYKDRIAAYIYSPYTRADRPVFMLENRIAIGEDIELKDPKYRNVTNGLLLYSSISNSVSSENYVRSPTIGGSSFRFMDPITGLNQEHLSFSERSRYDAITYKEPFVDPITGIRIEIEKSAFKGGNKTFRVTYDNDARVCFKEKIQEQTGRIRLKIKENNEQESFSRNRYSKSVFRKPIRPLADKLTVRRGDEFYFVIDSYMKNPAYCPRERINISLSDNNFYGWIKGVDKPDLRTLKRRFSNSEIIKRSFEDYDKENFIGRLYKVREDAPLGLQKMSIAYTKEDSNERVFEKVLIDVIDR